MIEKIAFNWYVTSEGDEYFTYEVGKEDVVRIEEHRPQFAGDRWYFDVIKEGGNFIRVFNPNKVYYRQ